MSGIASLQALRAATIKNAPIKFIKKDGDKEEPVDSIKEASHALFGSEGVIYDLNESTNFQNEGVKQPLKAVVFCWLHEKSSIVDYKNECLETGIPDFKFLVKAELTTWLNGSSEACTFIQNDEASTGDKRSTKEPAATTLDIAAATAASTSTSTLTSDSSKKRKLEDPQLDRIGHHERDSIDHSAALRGAKNIDFSYLVSDAKKFIGQMKGSKPSSRHVSSKANGATPKKQPIILVSPATTSLISLANIKEFLENGRFVEPGASSHNRPANGLVTIHRNLERTVSAGHHFMVVDNVEVFTKPEYWDRVVAIFTTGQAWQFAKYKYSKPEELFQRYAGYFVCYQGDVVPKQIKDWNVTEIKVDRGDKRFRDKMIVRDFWADMEKILVSKGYGKS